jgi:hypothetical protein
MRGFLSVIGFEFCLSTILERLLPKIAIVGFLLGTLKDVKGFFYNGPIPELPFSS